MNFKTKLSLLLPNVFKKVLLNSYYEYKSNKYRGDIFQCSVCNSKINKFISLDSIRDGKFMLELEAFGELHSVDNYETLNLLNFLCPVCGAQDKARLYALYFKHYFQNKVSNKKLKLIHFAPEGGLSNLLKWNKNIEYRSADLFRNDVDDNVDLTNMSIYGNSVIDIFICSHILEHIIRDDLAISELYRILKAGGWGIIMVPILLSLNSTWEDNSKITEKDREKYFGQDDHVRVYEKHNFINRLEKHGFIVEQLGIDYFGSDQFSKFGIDERSILYIVTKK
jgi:SAM-dependent methyltransferase